MPKYHFYQIRSKKQADSPELIQVSLACQDYPLIMIFAWLWQSNGQPKHIQLFFEEQILDWHQNAGIALYETNRRHQILAEMGQRKGSRTMSQIEDQATLLQAREILQNSEVPPAFQNLIRVVLEESKFS